MYALFEEAGKYVAGRILSQNDSSAQIELDSGKRVKAKSSHIVLQFDKPSPAELMATATTASQDIDVQLLWEFAPEEEFSFGDIAKDYFQDPASTVEQAATLLALFQAPHYFRRAGGPKGRFKKAPAEIVQQALAAIEKKARIQAQIDDWSQQLVAGACPAPIQEQLDKILFKPDKNAAEYKAVVQASKDSHLAPLTLLQRAGAIHSPYEFHWQRFLFENFPKGVGFPALQAPEIDNSQLPLAEVQAFSIDDASTTEIDDALSVTGLGSDSITVGIHIAAPGLAVQPGDAIDEVARQRLSTVYMPGYKITMLPESVVQPYTLGEGMARPALSFYATFDADTLALTATRSAIERVPIAANLRLNDLEEVVTPEWLTSASPEHIPAQVQPFYPALGFLWRLAQHLKAQREVVRGKPETFSRPDYSFHLERDAALKGTPPDGTENVVIEVRRRGEPLDLMVAECMILVNHHWGQLLADLGVPGIYRSQAALAPGVKVRMSTKALPHAGLGVPCYAWSTSPLRRYTDLVNQWQLIAAIQNGATATLAAPFKPKDALLFGIISAFDTTHSTYHAYQASMERFWTLQYIQRHAIQELEGSVIKEGLVRANTLPLVISTLGTEGLPRNAQVRVRLGEIDLMALDVAGNVVARLDDVNVEASEEEDSDNDDVAAGPLHIAVDVNESEAGEGN